VDEREELQKYERPRCRFACLGLDEYITEYSIVRRKPLEDYYTRGVAAMPKKSATARSGAQRQRPRTQKSFELVRPTTTATETTASLADNTQDEELNGQSVATMTATDQTETVENEPEQDTLAEEDNDTVDEAVIAPIPTPPTRKNTPASTILAPTPTTSTPTKGGAAARFAARRQAQQRAQQKNVASLVTTEHFAYVRRDLIVIAILAVIMFAAIIILYFTIGR
jgi:hypothetical protein